MADRTRDATWIAVVIEDLLDANPGTTLPEIDQELRDAGSQCYLIAGPGKFRMVTGGKLAMLRAVVTVGMTVEQNRTVLAEILSTT